MGLGEVINSAVDAVTGGSSGTTLEDFLTKFTPASGTYVNTIDPLNTFEVQMFFYPSAAASTEDKEDLQKLGDAAAAAGASALNNLANNATGGLVGAIANSKKDSILDQHKKFGDIGRRTFIKYLAEACLLLNSDNTLNLSFGQSPVDPLVLNLGFYVQQITVPQLKIDITQSDTLLGKFPANGLYVSPDNSEVVLSIINTKLPLIETLFYPWMREVTLPYWSYSLQPYTTATIIVDFTKHSNIKYAFYGCRPTKIQTIAPTQEPSTELTRDVVLTFDFLAVQSTYKTSESVKDKLLGSAASLARSASNMLNL